MKTDRELLKLAAKAAGYPPEWRGNILIEEDDGPRKWNPLTDDGDALRLAVGLGMRLELPKYLGYGTSAGIQRDGIAGCSVFRDNPMEQTRRAIVMAAAELGKMMP